MDEVTREDVEGSVFADDFHYDQFVSLITKHVEIQIPDKFNILKREPQTQGDGTTKIVWTAADDVLRKELADYVFTSIQEQDKEEEPEDNEFGPVDLDKEEPDKLPEIKIDEELEIKIDMGLGSKTSPEKEVVEEPKVEDEEGIEDTAQVDKDSKPHDEELSDDVLPTVTEPASVPTSSPPFADRKSHIIALVKQSKWTLKQVIQIIDDGWGYAIKGKSSKTRVSKTIRDLRETNLLYEESNGVLMWRGEG